MPGAPNLRDLITDGSKVGLICLNHPQTIPPTQVHGKVVFYQIGP